MQNTITQHTHTQCKTHTNTHKHKPKQTVCSWWMFCSLSMQWRGNTFWYVSGGPSYASFKFVRWGITTPSSSTCIVTGKGAFAAQVGLLVNLTTYAKGRLSIFRTKLLAWIRFCQTIIIWVFSKIYKFHVSWCCLICATYNCANTYHNSQINNSGAKIKELTGQKWCCCLLDTFCILRFKLTLYQLVWFTNWCCSINVGLLGCLSLSSKMS
jgi:hypothetical protein